ncbi:MAG: aminopeptidase P family N-terminal domain-containing protein [Clostridium fessum]
MNQTNVKIGQLRDRMKELGIDAYLVPTADFHESEYVGEFFKCRHFLTGFNGTAGTAVITMDKAGLWTDGRYFVQAEEQLSGSEIKLYRMGEPEFPTLDEFLEEELPVDGCLGFDGRVVNSELGYGLQNLLQEKCNNQLQQGSGRRDLDFPSGYVLRAYLEPGCKICRKEYRRETFRSS